MTTKETYRFIHDVMEMDDFPLETRLKILEQTKRELRRRQKHKINPFEETYHYRGDDWESYYSKEFFHSTFTEEEKEEFIESQWIRIYSPYDCTGRKFTTSIRICNFKELNSFGAMSCVYHFFSLDV